MSTHQVTRREFIKGAAIAGAAVATSGVFSATPALAAPPIPDKWDKEADIVILGAGGTGLVAAIEAVEAGASVIVLEKSGAVGGTTKLSGAVIQAAGTSFQKNLAKVAGDTPDAHYQYWMKAAEGSVNPDLVKVLATNAPANIEWLVAHGLTYVSVYGVDSIPYVDPKLMVPRIHVPGGMGEKAQAGTGVVHVNALNDIAVKKGVQFLLKTPATGLFFDPDKGVVGVRAQAESGAIAVKAKKGVIIATSSFDQNKEMARAFSPQQLWALTTGVCLAVPASTGDGIKMALEVGADLDGMGGTIGVPNTGVGVPASMSTTGQVIPGIWVNKYGQRFVNEESHYAYAMRAVFFQEDHLAWAIFDEAARKQNGKALGGLFGAWSDDLSKEIAAGTVKKGDTLKALGAALGMPNPAKLQATVDAWNSDVAAGTDGLFGKQGGLKPLSTAPFYATQVTEANLGSIGGVKINTKAQVINVWGKVIPRLYAGGMAAGGLIGPYYPGSGTAIATTVCFGRIAAQNAVAEKPWSTA